MRIRTIFDFIRFSMSETDEQFQTSEDIDWEQLYEFSVKQALVGLMFHGVEKVANKQKPPKQLLMKWFLMTEQIKARNQKLNEVAVNLTKIFGSAEIENCILKGQGNATMYNNPYSRMPGDIDIWINRNKTQIKEGKLIVGERKFPIVKQSYRHIELGLVDGVDVEVHLRPSFMNNPIHNYQLQHWFCEQEKKQFLNHKELPGGVGMINMPTIQFNLIYQLSHINNHFFYEGIGLRQFVDYYYVLKNATSIDRSIITSQLKKLGLYKMAGAVMYIEREIFNLDDKFLIVPVNEKAGKMLYDEILLSGNFGHFDQRTANVKSRFGKNMMRFERDLRLLRLFPSECMWEPIFRGYHFFWRLVKGNI